MLPRGCELRCPGCAHRELSAQESETSKLGWLKRALAPWEQIIEPVRAAAPERRWNYRDRTVLHAKLGASGWEFGMRRPRQRGEREGEFVAIPRCPVHTERVRRAIALFSEGLSSLPEMDFRFLVLSGSLATLVIKASPESATGCSEALSSLAARLSERLRDAGIEGVFANFNPVAGRRVFSSRGWKHLFGSPHASGETHHGPQSFQQLLPELFEDALTVSAAWLEPAPGDFVLDLYSGLGTSVRKWKALGAQSVGVELLGEAAGALPESVLRGRASDRIPQLQARIDSWRNSASYAGHALTLFANPPRTGLEPQVIDWLAEWPAQTRPCRPQKIAYLSCSAGTLARDLSKLENCAYRVKRILPYDFFPQTIHVETLALLELDPALGVSSTVDGERLRRPE